MRSVFVILGCFLVVLSIDANGQMMDDFATTDEDENVTFSVTDNDAVALPQPNTVDLNTTLFGRQTTATTSEGRYTVTNSGDVTFDPANDFFGSSSLEYSMNYGFFGLSVGTATIRVTVNSVNDPPVTKDDDDEETNEDTPVNVNVLANDTEPDGDTLSVVSVTQGANGAVAINPDKTVKYSPNLNFFGSDSFTYTIDDGHGASQLRLST